MFIHFHNFQGMISNLIQRGVGRGLSTKYLMRRIRCEKPGYFEAICEADVFGRIYLLYISIIRVKGGNSFVCFSYNVNINVLLWFRIIKLLKKNA